MHRTKRNEGFVIASEHVAEIERLFERGLYMQAHECARALAPLVDWRGTAARVIGGRLAANLGAQRMGRWLQSRAWLADRTSADAAYFHACDVLHYRGPFAAWRFLERLPPFTNSTDNQRGNLLALRARVASGFRDFERAEKWLEEAAALGATASWLLCDRAFTLETQDAIDDALAAAREALRIRPWFRTAVQMAAGYLQMLSRDDEARTLLIDALEHIESGAVAGQLAMAEFEMGLHRESLASLQRTQDWSPLRDEQMKKWLSARMAEAHYHCGEFTKAAVRAREVGDDFYKEFGERLSTLDVAKRRVYLPVGFVRQHYMTCAPATLSALSRFWKMPVDHGALAAEICYDGTPDHVERNWAEENGYVVREFRVTWDAAIALLDRGLPFTLTVTETTSSHLQAVIGYDAIRGTLIIRDPYQRIHSELAAAPFLQNYAPFGPRGMALAPTAEAVRLDGIELPDVEFYDSFYRIQRALLRHDREAAVRELEKMKRLDAGNRLTIFARKHLATYDGSLQRQLEAVEELLTKYPKSGALLSEKLFLLRQLGRRSEQREFLHALASSKTSEPLFWREWSQELMQDARELPFARQHALRAIRYRQTEAENLAQLGHVLWSEREFEMATELYRLAACMRDKVESFSRSYFLAARHVRKTDAALTWLRVRQEKFGRQSSQPVRLLFLALTVLDQTTEAFERLEKAIALRPDDGELLLFAADAFARYGNRERADALLTAAENRATRTPWLRTAAALAGYRCDLAHSLELWREILSAEPLAGDAQQAITRFTAEVEGRSAALAYLCEMSARFPHHVPLHRLLVEWTRGEGAQASEAVIRQTLALDANDAWTRRELATCLAQQRRFDEAVAEAQAAMQIEPTNPVSHAVRGYVALAANDHTSARENCRAALRLSIDFAPALTTLLDASDSFEEKRASLGFIREELTHQVVFGDGLISYREAAFTVLDPPELLANLREALASRPDLWHAWSTMVRQLLDMQQLDEALALAQQAVERFPLLPRVWFDLALVHRARGERDQEIPPLRRALQINPAWGHASRTLADAVAQKGDREEERRVLDHAIAASPLDPLNHGALAQLLWRTGDKDAAIAELQTAIRLDPSFDWGWNTLRAWLLDAGKIERAAELAHELTTTRPGEARSWFRLAQSLDSSKLDERITALDRSIELNPRFIEAHDMRAMLLADAGRFDEATAACAPPVFTENLPKELIGRAAWIFARRGDVISAIEKMREVVKGWPNYYWGWSMIAEWLAQQGRFRESLEAARMLVRLAPGSAIALGYVADAQLHLDEQKEAIETLRKAFELDPSYGFAGYTIFDLQVRARERAAAEKTLAILEMHLPGARTAACRVRFQSAWLEKENALAGLRQLCFATERDTPALEEAAKAFTEAGWRRDAEKVFADLLDDPGVNAQVAALWVDSFTSRGAWRYRRRLRQLDLAAPLGRRARLAYLGALGRLKKARYLRRVMRRDAAALRTDTPCWGQAGFALASNNLFGETAKWMRDWRAYKDAEAWMLSNAALAFRDIGNDAEADAVSRHALTLRGDHTTRLHQLWVACGEAIAGEYASARARLATVRSDDLKPIPEAVYALTSALVAVDSAPEQQRSAVYQQHRLCLKQPRFQPAFRSRSLKRLATKSIQTMARAARARPFRVGRRKWNDFGRGRRPWYLLWIAVVLISALSRTCSSLDSPSASNRSSFSRPSVPADTPYRSRPLSSLDELKQQWKMEDEERRKKQSIPTRSKSTGAVGETSLDELQQQWKKEDEEWHKKQSVSTRPR